MVQASFLYTNPCRITSLVLMQSKPDFLPHSVLLFDFHPVRPSDILEDTSALMNVCVWRAIKVEIVLCRVAGQLRLLVLSLIKGVWHRLWMFVAFAALENP